jgi:hypothetical protein
MFSAELRSKMRRSYSSWQRGGALTNLETKLMIENVIDKVKGGSFLKLSPYQYVN